MNRLLRYALCGLISFGVIMMLGACQDPSKMLIGEWEVNQADLIQQQQALELTPPVSVITEELSKPLGEWRLAFTQDQKISMLINGELLQGRYQINRVVSNTLYLRADIKPIYDTQLDETLKLSSAPSQSRTRRLSMRISGDEATLSYHDMSPLKLSRSGRSTLEF